MLRNRKETKKIKINNIFIGGSDKILIQSMCNVKTENVDDVVKQINECEKLGADLMRVSVMDIKDAEAIKKIKARINIPLVADIHFDYRLALLAIENGADKIRINPGNIGNEENIKKVVNACKKKDIPIRIGVNSGSIDKTIYNYDYKYSAKNLVDSAIKHVNILEKLGFFNIVISLKGSSVKETIEAYKIASETFPYPLHLGITEAGFKDISLIRSAATLSPLLLDGIGDTIRISMTDSPKEEVIAAKRLLHDVGLYKDYPTLISCPTCGRTQVDVKTLSKKVMKYLEKTKKAVTVAIMGCVVNGPGEAKNADIGIAGGNHEFVIFQKGKPNEKVKEKDVFKVLIKKIESL